MLEFSLSVSRVINLLIALFLMINAGMAILRVRDLALRYGRISMGLVGLGMLCTHVERQFGDQLGALTSWIQIGGTLVMLVGAYRIFRLFRKYPDARKRSLNLFGVGE